MCALPVGNDISTPFNFKHEIHVNARFTGFPASWRYYGLPDGWAAALQSQPAQQETPYRRPRTFLPSFRKLSPCRRWKKVWASWTVQLYPHPEEDENISLPFNFKHEVHANSKHTTSWHAALILAAEDSWQTTLAYSQHQRSTTARGRRPKFLTFAFPRPLRRKRRHDADIIPSSCNQMQPPPPYPEPKTIYLKIRFTDVGTGPYRSTFVVKTGMSFREVLKLVCERRRLDPHSYAFILDFGDQKGCFKVPLDHTTVTPSDNFRELTLMRHYF